MMHFGWGQAAHNLHYASYYKVVTSELNNTAVGTFRDESLKLTTTGNVFNLAANPNFRNHTFPVIKCDIEMLREATHLAMGIEPHIIKHWLDDFELLIFDSTGNVQTKFSTADYFRKVFFEQVVVDFHQLVQLILQSSDGIPSENLKIAYTSLMERLPTCIGGIQSEVLEGLEMLISPLEGQSQNLARLREDIASAAIAEHISDDVQTGAIKVDDEKHVVNYVKYKYAKKYGLRKPRDVFILSGCQDVNHKGLVTKLDDVLSVFKIAENIKSKTNSVFMDDLTTNKVKLVTIDVVHLAEPVYQILSKHLKACLGAKAEGVIKMFSQKYCSSYSLDELLDWFSDATKSKDEKATLDRDALKQDLTTSAFCRQGSAWLVVDFKQNIFTSLQFKFRETAGMYIAMPASEAVNSIFTGDGEKYLLKQEYEHNLRVVIASGLQSTMTKRSLDKLAVMGPHSRIDKVFFTYTKGLSYFWIEQGYEKRPVKLADISKIKLSSWDANSLLRCFACAIRSPFNAGDLACFLDVNIVTPIFKNNLKYYIDLLNGLIEKEPEKYISQLLLMDESAVKFPILGHFLKQLSTQEPYLKFLSIKVMTQKISSNEIEHIFKQVPPRDFMASYMCTCETTKSQDKDFMIKTILEWDNIPYLTAFHEAGIKSSIGVSRTKFLTRRFEDVLPLFSATVVFKAEKIFKLLAINKAFNLDLNEVSERHQFSALHCAIFFESYDFAMRLIQLDDIKVNALTQSGEHALTMCLKKKTTEESKQFIIAFLNSGKINFGIKVDRQTLRKKVLNSRYKNELLEIMAKSGGEEEEDEFVVF